MVCSEYVVNIVTLRSIHILYLSLTHLALTTDPPNGRMRQAYFDFEAVLYIKSYARQ